MTPPTLSVATPRELLAFLDALYANPDDAGTALVLADLLQEGGDEAKATYIRLQVRAAEVRRDCLCGSCVKRRGGGQHHNGPCAVSKERIGHRPITHHITALLAANPGWTSLPCPGIGTGSSHYPCDNGTVWDGPGGGQRAQRTCPTCGGSGDLLKTLEVPQDRPAHWKREPVSRITPALDFYAGGGVPFVRSVGGSLADVVREVTEMCHCRRHNGGTSTRMGRCPTCDDTRRVTRFSATPWAAAVAPHVREFRVTDREPNSTTFPNEAGWYFHNGTARDYSHWLPAYLLEPMRQVVPKGDWRKRWDGSGEFCLVVFPTSQAAVSALGRNLHRLVTGGVK